MSTATPDKPTASPAKPAGAGRFVEFDEYVDFQLEKARTTIKSTDLLTGAAVVAAIVIGYLLMFLALDQWVIAGGLSVPARWSLLALLVGGLGVWIYRQVVRPIFLRINRLYAAREIERSEPELHSNLLNLVDLANAGRPVDEAVLRSLQKRAARQLSKTNVAEAIDHRPLLRSAYVLLGLVVVFSLYVLLSPKKIGHTLWRVLPFVDVAPVTQTEIRDVSPGDATVLARTRVEVVVELAGKLPSEAQLRYTTADRRLQDEVVILKPATEGLARFHGVITGEDGSGVRQDFSYVIQAGDAYSKRYHVSVHQPPSAVVERIHLEFPAYMKRRPEDIAGGQINSLEGVTVTLQGTTNLPIALGTVQFLNEPTGGPTGEEVPVEIHGGTQFTATWPLTFRPENGTYARHYRIQCQTATGEKDPAPTIYNINIRPDLPPEVNWVHPERDQDVPANAVVPVTVQARDPDFELSALQLHIEKDGQAMQRLTLSEGKRQQVIESRELALEQFDLKPGDEITLRAEAFDNRQPKRNRKETPRIKLRVGKPVSPREQQEQLRADRQQQQQRIEQAQQEQANEDARRDDAPRDDAQSTSEPGGQSAQSGSGSEDRQQTRPDEGREPSPNDPANSAPRDPQHQSNPNSSGRGNAPGAQSSQGESGQNQSSQPGSQQRPRTNDQPGAANAPDNDQQSSKLNPDGSDDEEALRKLIDQLRTKRNQRPNQGGEQPEPSSSDSNPAPDSTSREPRGGSNASGTGRDQTHSNNPKPESNPSQGNDNAAESPSSPNGTKPNGKTDKPRSPREKPRTDDPAGADNAPGANAPAEQSAKPTKPNDKTAEKPSGQDSDPAASGERTPSKETPKGKETRPGESPSTPSDPKRGPQADNQTADPQSDPNATQTPRNAPSTRKPQPKSGDNPPTGNQPASNAEAPPTAPDNANPDTPRNGEPNATKPPRGNPDAPPKGSTPKPNTTGDQPNQTADEHPADNDVPPTAPDTKRQPSDQPQPNGPAGDKESSKDNGPKNQPPKGRPGAGRDDVQPQDADPQPSSEPSKVRDGRPGDEAPTPNRKPKPTKQPNPDRVKDDETPTERGNQTPNAPNTDPPRKAPGSGDDELQGEGRRQGKQRSDAPQGGEKGTSKEATEGASGSDDSGPGESVKRPGQLEKRPGEGNPARDQDSGTESRSGEGRKPGGTDENPSPNSEANPKGGDPKGGDPKGGDPKGGDPKGGDPKGGDPKGGDPKGGDPKGGDPKGGDPKGGDPKGSDPKGSDPKGGDPKGGDPKGGDPKGGDPKGGDPKGGDPKGGDPKGGDPKGGDPKGGDPKGGDPKGGDPKGGDPKGGDPKGGDPKGGDPKGGDPKGGDPKGGDPKGGDPKGGDPKGGDPKGGDSGEGANKAPGVPAGKSKPSNTPSGAGKGTPDPSQPTPGNPQDGGGMGNGGQGRGVGDEAPETESTAEEVTEEYNLAAAELVLQKLKQQLDRGDVDPQLLQDLGWTPDELKNFADRLQQHVQATRGDEPETPESIARREQFEEMLKQLELRKAGSKKAGNKTAVRELEQSGTRRTPPPATYRSAYERFTKSLNRQSTPTDEKRPSSETKPKPAKPAK